MEPPASWGFLALLSHNPDLRAVLNTRRRLHAWQDGDRPPRVRKNLNEGGTGLSGASSILRTSLTWSQEDFLYGHIFCLFWVRLFVCFFVCAGQACILKLSCLWLQSTEIRCVNHQACLDPVLGSALPALEAASAQEAPVPTMVSCSPAQTGKEVPKTLSTPQQPGSLLRRH